MRPDIVIVPVVLFFIFVNVSADKNFQKMSNDYFGWDLLHKTIEKQISTESDIIIALVHWYLTTKSGFRCLGVGDDKTLLPTDVGSELMPDGWNASQDSYALRYVHNKKLYLLLGAKTEDNLVINLLDSDSRSVSNITLNPKADVKLMKGPLQSMIPDISKIVLRINKELVEPVFGGNKKELSTQTNNQQPAPDPRPSSGMRLPTGDLNPIPDYHMGPDINQPLRNIGRGDLDPFGRGGGMVFNPPPFGFPPHLNPVGGFRLPPPGSRFDPFGPPDAGMPRPNPNQDHFRPPPDFDYY